MLVMHHINAHQFPTFINANRHIATQAQQTANKSFWVLVMINSCFYIILVLQPPCIQVGKSFRKKLTAALFGKIKFIPFHDPLSFHFLFHFFFSLKSIFGQKEISSSFFSIKFSHASFRAHTEASENCLLGKGYEQFRSHPPGM